MNTIFIIHYSVSEAPIPLQTQTHTFLQHKYETSFVMIDLLRD